MKSAGNESFASRGGRGWPPTRKRNGLYCCSHPADLQRAASVSDSSCAARLGMLAAVRERREAAAAAGGARLRRA